MRTLALDIHVGRQVLVNGVLCVMDRFEGSSIVVLKRVGTPTCMKFTRNELAQLAMSGQYTDVDAPHLPEPDKTSTFNLANLKESTRKRVLRRIAYVNDAKDLIPIGPKNTKLAHSIRYTAERLSDQRPPSPHTVYRWLRLFKDSGHDSTVFARDAYVHRTRKSRLDENAHELIEAALIEELSNQKGGSVHGVFDNVMKKVASSLGYTRFRSIKGADTLISGNDSFQKLSVGNPSTRSE